MIRRAITHTISAGDLFSCAAMRPRSMNSRSVKQTFTHSVRLRESTGMAQKEKAPHTRGEQPLGGGREAADMNALGPGQHEVAEAADEPFQPASFYAHRAFRHIVERARQVSQAGSGAVPEELPLADPLGLGGLDPRFSYTLVRHSLTPRRNAPISEDGATGHDERAERLGRGDQK